MKRQRRPRRLVPDPELFRRRASGESLRALAADYGVRHTTLSRYFRKPEARRQLQQARPPVRAERDPRLRRLVPDPELFRRRAAGESLRALAPDYRVQHTTLGRYFRRPQARRQLRQAGQLLRTERRASQARRREQRREERLFAQQVRRQAKEQATRERRLKRRDRAVRAQIAARRDLSRARGKFAVFLDEQDLRRPPSRADLASRNDRKAAQAVAAGGGIAAVIETTGLHSRQNILRLIDPQILKQALKNDAAAAAATQTTD